MWFFSLRSESALGWVIFVLGIAVQIWAVAVIIGDLRRRRVAGGRVNGWDVAALVFVVVPGPGAAIPFLAVHSVLEKRDLARRRRVAS